VTTTNEDEYRINHRCGQNTDIVWECHNSPLVFWLQAHWSAQHTAYDRELWRESVETAMLLQGHATWWRWWQRRSTLKLAISTTFTPPI